MKDSTDVSVNKIPYGVVPQLKVLCVGAESWHSNRTHCLDDLSLCLILLNNKCQFTRQVQQNFN